MNTQDMSCCACNEITGLRNHPDPKEAMKLFCQKQYQPRYGYDYYDHTESNQLYSFYIFTGVVGYKERRAGNVVYGASFAKFIKKNNLGDVVSSTPEYNRVNHPSHRVKVWVWRPKPRNLKSWWLKNKGNTDV